MKKLALALFLVMALAGCGGDSNSDPYPSEGTATLVSPAASRQSFAEARFTYLGQSRYLVRVTASALVPNKTHEVRFRSGASCTSELSYLATTDVTVQPEDPPGIAGWRLTAPPGVIATEANGNGEIEFVVESPPIESTIWRTTIVTVVGPIHPDPGYSGGVLPLACGPVTWSL